MSGLELRKIRKKLGLNQNLFGSQIGVTGKTIREWEKTNKLSDKAERLILDLLSNKGIKSLEEFLNVSYNSNNKIGGDNILGDKNFLNEPNENYLSKTEIENQELKEEIKRLNKELLECKNEIIQLLKNK